jgi:hypothetical protein
MNPLSSSCLRLVPYGIKTISKGEINEEKGRGISK